MWGGSLRRNLCRNDLRKSLEHVSKWCYKLLSVELTTALIFYLQANTSRGQSPYPSGQSPGPYTGGPPPNSGQVPSQQQSNQPQGPPMPPQQYQYPQRYPTPPANQVPQQSMGPQNHRPPYSQVRQSFKKRFLFVTNKKKCFCVSLSGLLLQLVLVHIQIWAHHQLNLHMRPHHKVLDHSNILAHLAVRHHNHLNRRTR